MTPAPRTWPAWAPHCLTTAGEIEGIPDQDLIIRLFATDSAAMRDAWAWGINQLPTCEAEPRDLCHLLLFAAIKNALFRVTLHQNGHELTPGQCVAHFQEIATKARELAHLLESSAFDWPVIGYLHPADLREVRIRTPEGLFRLTLMDDAGEPHPDDTADNARPAAALLRPELRLQVETKTPCTHTPDLLRTLAQDAEDWGAELANPTHHLSPRVSMKARPKVFIRALARSLCITTPPEPAHLATLANSALNLTDAEGKVRPHQAEDWLKGFNHTWQSAVLERRPD